MSCCLDTNHFVVTPTFFRIILLIFTLCGEGQLFYARLPEPCFSLLCSDHFVSPVTDSLLFLNKWKIEKIHERMCGTQVSTLGLLANDLATVSDGLPWTSCNFM